MWAKIKIEMKVVGVLFVFSLAMFGVLFSASMLVIAPLVRWSKSGVLHFPVSWPELLRLFWFVLWSSTIFAVGVWLANKFDQRNKN